MAGRFLYHCIPYRRKLVLANMDQVFGEQLAFAEKIYLAKSYYSHLATSFKEALQLRFMNEQSLRDKVEVIGHEKMLSVVAQKKGVLVVTGHFGNWEFAPLGGVLNFKEFQGQFHFIRRTLRFKALETVQHRKTINVTAPSAKVSDYFNMNVFNDDAMKTYLSKVNISISIPLFWHLQKLKPFLL